MIESWQHKGLEAFFLYGSTAAINCEHKKKIETILQQLNAATTPEEMNLPSFNYHKLHGKLKGFYSVTVRANWRIIFKFIGKNAILVNYLDYH